MLNTNLWGYSFVYLLFLANLCTEIATEQTPMYPRVLSDRKGTSGGVNDRRGLVSPTKVVIAQPC